MTIATEIPKELLEKIHAHRAKHVGGSKPRYPRWAKDELLQFFECGMKATAIAAATGVSADLIYSWAKDKRAMQKILKPEKFTELKIVEAREPRIELRVRIGQAEIFGLTIKTLAELLRETGQLSR